MDDTSVETTLVCHARTPLVFDPVEERVERAQALEGSRLVDDVVLRSWPETIRLDSDPHHEALETFRRFEAWADRRDVTVRPPFEIRTRSSMVEDDGVQVLVTPVLCLAVYRDGQLASVYPHTDGERTYTADRALEHLEAGHLPRPLRGRRDVPAAETCPECGTALVNGQGLFDCPACDWRGTLSRDEWSAPEQDSDSDPEPEPDTPDAGPGQAPSAGD